MNTFFPKHTVQWHFEEPTILRRLSISLVEMAVITGVVMRLYRVVVNTGGAGNSSWLWVGGTFAFGLLLLCAAATIHLANYPLQRWVLRAPVFALVEAAAESVTSILLIWLGREHWGSARAEWSDWLPMSLYTVWTRLVIVCGWAITLAAVVWIVRRTLLREQKVEEDTVPAE
jgi:hypothetical protein